ncbi:MAG: NAD-dependent epimerase/dehydratase family protein [Patescibacteria group bacterium]|nr:NAD-dependent epimerase/dehydratase family protein [Patescibacteria group bacterium]
MSLQKISSKIVQKIAFVTGGTGFVGFYIIKNLLENNISVKALIRKNSDKHSVEKLRSLGVKLIGGNILNPNSYSSALDGINYVFHSAAIHKIWIDDINLLYKTNVEATENLLNLAVQKGIEQFIYTSSIKTIGLLPENEVANEKIPYNFRNIDNDYGQSKYLSEKLLLESNENISIKILNPAAVIGPNIGNKSIPPTMELIYRFLKGKNKASLDTRIGLVDVRDVGRAHFLALTKAKEKEKYILCAANLTMNDLFKRIAKAANLKLKWFEIPYWFAYLIAYLNLAVSYITKIPPIVAPKSLHIARLKPGYDGTKSQKELGLDYINIDKTIKDTVDWLKDKNI